MVRAVQDGDNYRLYGEKYFASNAGMAGVAMVLARIDGAKSGSRGLTLFAVPWRDESGELNGISIRRLKDKLGVRAVPSGEVEVDGALAYVVGDSANGLKYMMEALNLSRICNAVASVGIMRRALAEAQEYAENRDAFGRKLTDFPMVQDTLGKLTAKMEIELLTVFDLIKLYDRVVEGQVTAEEVVLNRLFIAIIKKETAEQAIHFAHEAIELHGGNGYIEDFVTPRLLRDAQVLTVWEGTANILALELVRLVRKFDAHLLFVNFIQERLDSLKGDSKWCRFINEELERFSTTLNVFAALDEKTQTLEAKAIAHKMALLYESMIAAETAEKLGNKYELLADIYLENTWSLREIGQPASSLKLFN